MTMKITVKKEKKFVKFGEVEIADVFAYNSKLYIKTPQFKAVNDVGFNALMLNGLQNVCCFHNDDEVTLKNAELFVSDISEE